jgi:hypothetical protein
VSTFQGGREKDEHRLLGPDDLDRNFFANLARLILEDSRTNDIGEHALANGREYLVTTAVELLTKDNLIVTFRIRRVVQRCRDESR